ncbi:HutD family protein [Vagococcus hydrophili]|uniref:HutD-family protein n=1 Tax=Vagococcus hydrophili TaxID=2714947 RepID=A0A6G8AUT7_9ENTE|nr:HutD family protein [Vagococcus hydrophili]QIL48828.1 hypothetical protein G7082_10065 [Vagococcus hydrophili]
MNKKIISQSDYQVSSWSGGETTEVFLFPPSGQYELNKFDFRISTAKVALNESNFSSLPGYKRIIMSLDNPLELHHSGKKGFRKEVLAPFQTDYFCGSDETKSFGKCTDFNLIYRPNLGGEMKTKQTGAEITLKEKVFYVYFALENCQLVVNGTAVDEEIIDIKKGDSLVIADTLGGEKVKVCSTIEEHLPVVIEVSVR